MLANSKIEVSVGKVEAPIDLCKTTRLPRLKPLLLLFILLELLPAFINIAQGLDSPFFSPAHINQHVYHHIHFLIYGFPVGFSIWLVMDLRVRELERKLSMISPISANADNYAPGIRARLAHSLPQAILFFAFWFGWDDFKFHYLSSHWSLVHEILCLLR